MEFKKTKLVIIFLALAAIGLGWFFIFSSKKIVIESKKLTSQLSNIADINKPDVINKVEKQNIDNDIEPQKPLVNPPKIIKGIYFTSWSGGTESRINYLLKLKKETQINTVVIDIKDYSGAVTYDTDLPQVIQYKAKEIRIAKINSLIKKLHDEGIYVIARIATFQDQALTKARPDLAVKKRTSASSTQTYPTWRDNKGLAWADMTSKEVWDYNIAIAKDAANRGFDEINFDYIRFPSDGPMALMYFPAMDPKSTKAKVLRSFFEYLRKSLSGVKISADIFGLVTTQKDDMGIGQVLEDVVKNFDYVSPMVYPSHYYPGTLGYKNPADHPYEVVKHSLDSALKRIIALEDPANITSSTVSSSSSNQLVAEIRPWLQDFNLGAIYTANMVKAEIKANTDSLGDRFNGFMLWNPSNVYTQAAVQ